MPIFKPGNIFSMDNPGSHKRTGTRALIEAAGSTLLFLPPPYSPDFASIEKDVAKPKAKLDGSKNLAKSASL